MGPTFLSKFISFNFLVIILSSCSFINRKGSWGKRAIYPLSKDRIIKAFKDNATSKHVWIPLVGAGVTHWGGYDQKITNWASHESSVFKNREQADNWSDNFNNILKYEMYASILLTPSMDEDKAFASYAFNKIKGGVVVNVASTSTRFTRQVIARSVNRQRPNKLDLKSFPSGHSSEAGSRNRLVSRNMDYIDMNDNLRLGINALNTTMSASTLWARLEGKRHYPSDVLVGYALGSFVSGVIYDSLMNQNEAENFSIIPANESVFAQYSISF